MIDVNQRLLHELSHTTVILQVHDALIFEVPEKDLKEAERLVKTGTDATGKKLGWSVPFKVDLGNRTHLARGASVVKTKRGERCGTYVFRERG